MVKNISCLIYLIQSKRCKIVLGELPKTRSEKSELYKMIQSTIPTEVNDPGLIYENFKEALHLINTSVTPTTIPSNVQSVLDDNSCKNLTQNVSRNFLMFLFF